MDVIYRAGPLCMNCLVVFVCEFLFWCCFILLCFGVVDFGCDVNDDGFVFSGFLVYVFFLLVPQSGSFIFLVFCTVFFWLFSCFWILVMICRCKESFSEV
jgi:hypothetical protein